MFEHSTAGSAAGAPPPAFPIHTFRALRFPGHIACPRCAHQRVQRWGRFGWRQRYRCLGCRRTFSDFTGTPLAYLKHVDRWPTFCRLFPRAFSVRRTAVLLDVHPCTSFRWRHRLLDGLRGTERPALSGRVSVDLGWLPYSEKGARPDPEPVAVASVWHSSGRQAWVVVACDPRGASFGRYLGNVCPGWPRIRSALAGRLLPGTTLLYRTNRKIRIEPAAAALGVGSELERSVGREPGGRSPELARSYLARYRRWERRFRGVATRYLDNYLVWFRLIDVARHRARPFRGLQSVLVGTFPSRQPR